MNTPLPAPKMHPAILAAALSVSALSLAGIGALTGVLPLAQKTAETPPVAVQTTPATAPAAAPVAPPPQRSAARHVRTAPAVSQGSPDIEVTRRAPAAEPNYNLRTSSPAPAVCRSCGVVESVREVAQEGEASGLGAVAGGVVGGVLGNQVGAGRGRDAMTVLGAIGGAVAGHQIEKSQHKKVSYEIVVRFEDGTTRVMRQDTPPAWRQGDRVKVVNGALAADA